MLTMRDARYRTLQALHGVLGTVEVAIADPDVEFDLAAAHGGEAVRAGDEISGDEGEEVGRLGPGVVPFRTRRPGARMPCRVRLPEHLSRWRWPLCGSGVAGGPEPRADVRGW
jgi:hypothetical protein